MPEKLSSILQICIFLSFGIFGIFKKLKWIRRTEERIVPAAASSTRRATRWPVRKPSGWPPGRRGCRSTTRTLDASNAGSAFHARRPLTPICCARGPWNRRSASATTTGTASSPIPDALKVSTFAHLQPRYAPNSFLIQWNFKLIFQ